MKMLNVLMANDYVSLKKNKDVLFERLAPSKIKAINVIISDYDYQLLQKNKTVELESFFEIEILPSNMTYKQMNAYIKDELGLNLFNIEAL